MWQRIFLAPFEARYFPPSTPAMYFVRTEVVQRVILAHVLLARVEGHDDHACVACGLQGRGFRFRQPVRDRDAFSALRHGLLDQGSEVGAEVVVVLGLHEVDGAAIGFDHQSPTAHREAETAKAHRG